MYTHAEKTYTLKPQDFTPFVGSYFYQERNWRDQNKKLRHPEPYEKYYQTGLGLTAFNVLTGVASVYGIVKGLEALMK